MSMPVISGSAVNSTVVLGTKDLMAITGYGPQALLTDIVEIFEFEDGGMRAVSKYTVEVGKNQFIDDHFASGHDGEPDRLLPCNLAGESAAQTGYVVLAHKGHVQKGKIRLVGCNNGLNTEVRPGQTFAIIIDFASDTLYDSKNNPRGVFKNQIARVYLVDENGEINETKIGETTFTAVAKRH